MGDEDEGDAELALQGFQLKLHLLAQLEVQRPQRFVQQQDARLVDEGPGDGDALALAAGELPGLRLPTPGRRTSSSISSTLRWRSALGTPLIIRP